MIVDCPIKKEKDKNKAYKKNKNTKSMTFKKTKDGTFVCSCDSDGESDEDDEQEKRKAMISMGIHKKSSLFGSTPSCFMAKGSKVYHSDSDDDSPCAKQVKFDSDSESENESTNNDNLMEMMKQAEVLLISKGKECNKLRKKVAILEQAICELQANHDCLV